jgi:hypothetical protein
MEGMLRGSGGEVPDGKEPDQSNHRAEALRPSTLSTGNSMGEFFFLVRYCHS